MLYLACIIAVYLGFLTFNWGILPLVLFPYMLYVVLKNRRGFINSTVFLFLCLLPALIYFSILFISGFIMGFLKLEKLHMIVSHPMFGICFYSGIVLGLVCSLCNLYQEKRKEAKEKK